MSLLKPGVALALVATLDTPVLAQPGASTPQPADPGVALEDRSTVDYHGHLHEHWLPLTGDGKLLDSEDFYRKVGRPDLAQEHAVRRGVAYGLLVGSIVLGGVSAYYIARSASASVKPAPACDVNLSFSQFTQCVNASQATFEAQSNAGSSEMGWGQVAGLASVAALGFSVYYFTHEEPVSEDEAGRLVEDYNAHHVAVAPYAAPDGGGVTVAGKF